MNASDACETEKGVPMAMKACRECKKEISSDAKQCPNCGKKNPTGKTSKLAIGLGVLGLLVVIRASSGGSSTASTSNASVVGAPAAAPVAAPAMVVDNRKL